MTDGVSWVRAATTADLKAGEGFETDVEIDGEQVGLICVDGTYHAVGECPHEQGPLWQGIIEGSVVMCPWHSARFDVTTGQCLEGATACRVAGNIVAQDAQTEALPPCTKFAVKVEDGVIYVASAR